MSKISVGSDSIDAFGADIAEDCKGVGAVRLVILGVRVDFIVLLGSLVDQVEGKDEEV